MGSEDKCDFCHTGEDTEAICGTLHTDKQDGKVIAGHHKCMQYSASLVQYKFDEFGGFKKSEVMKEIKRGKRLTCHLCRDEKTRKKIEMKGATSGCALASCRKTFHYYCVSMNEKTVAKRYKVSAGNKEVILYRVFCSKLHEANYRDNISADEISGQGQSSGDDDDDDGEDNQDDSSGHSDNDEKSTGSKRSDIHDDEDETSSSSKRLKTGNDDEGEDEATSSGFHGMSSPPMTPDEVVLETTRQYHQLLEKQRKKAGPSSNISQNNGTDVGISIETDSGENITDGFNTSNAASPDVTDVSETGSVLNTSEQGPHILIPSKLEVGDLKDICAKAELPLDSILLWPSSYRGLEEKQMPFVMWDIANRVRKGDAKGLAKLMSDSAAPNYETLHQYMSRAKVDILVELQQIVNDVNIKYCFEVLRLLKLSEGSCDDFVLIVNFNTEQLGDFQPVLNFTICQWSSRTVLSFSSEKFIYFALERKRLLNWLIHRVGHRYELHVYPEEDTLHSPIGGLSIARSVVSKLKLNSQRSFTDCPVKVLVIQNVDRSVTKYKPYVNKVLQSFVYQHPGFECFCVVDILPEDDIREIGDIVPECMFSLSIEAYSSLSPTFYQVSCVVLHIDRDVRYTGQARLRFNESVDQPPSHH